MTPDRPERSGGPRSAAGKSRASRNALRHGLAALTHRPPEPTGEVNRLARAICGGDDDPLLLEAAVAIARNEIARRAIKAQQVAVIERLRDQTAIALAKGDNSLELAKARFLAAWLLNREIEARVPQLLAKYQVQRLPRGYFMDDEIVPIPLKALLQETESGEQYERARKGAEYCLKQQERADDEALEEAIPDLKRLDRYERRAWSQHKRAIGKFVHIKLMRDQVSVL